MLIQKLLSKDMYKYKCPYEMTPIGICVHNTYNDAPAVNEIKYMTKPENKSKVSFHVAVDDKEAIQAIPFNRNAFASGDGANGEGNRKYIHFEICYSKSGGTRFTQAEERCAKEIATILKEKNWGIERVKKHQDFSGKYCPHRTLDLGWTRFLNLIKKELGNTSKPSTNGSYVVRVVADVLNVREGSSTSYKVVTQLKKGDAYTIVEEKNGWGLLKSYQKSKNGWISLKYTERV